MSASSKVGQRFAGRSVIVTGGGSGIGAALSRALVEAGAYVTVADIDVPAATVVAQQLGARARPLGLDVTDAEAVHRAVHGVVAEHGRIDLMVNNAGITFGSETEDLTLEHWNAIIDVNLRGVVHGVAAAYPQMVRQGHGHIVNTASMGGLVAAGLITSYVTTKHAVVGLSLALRSEAAAKGVGVTALCPAAVDTPILDKGELGRFHGRDYYLKGQGVRRPLAPAVFADEALSGIARNRALVVSPRQARLAYALGRHAPRLMQSMSIRYVDKQRAMQAARIDAAAAAGAE
jgi:NAD(P)-dependent dehydrogenase (short-subunit alcohol dehydrogenase family)